jgi:hypothetical protein
MMAAIDDTLLLEFRLVKRAYLFFFIAALFAWRSDFSSLYFASSPVLTFLLLGYLHMNYFGVRLYPDYFQTRFTLLMKEHNVLYSEVIRAKGDTKTLYIYYKKHNMPENAKPKRIKIPVSEMHKDSRAFFIKTLHDRIILNRNRHPVAP